MLTTTIFFCTLVAASATFLVYPISLWVIVRLRRTFRKHRQNPRKTPYLSITNDRLPTIDMVIIGYAPGPLLRTKLENTLKLDYPPDKLRALIAFDGPADDKTLTEPLLNSPRVTALQTPVRLGKCSTINQTMQHATADIIVFSDMDAILKSDALRQLTLRLADPGIGCACGQRVIVESQATLLRPQRTYIDYDSRIKKLEEAALGSITSNDGKLYAMRRRLFQPMPAAVTDDLYNALTVILQGSRVTFAHNALAFIPKPSRRANHELSRRRRIVCRSLAGIFARPRLFVPWRYNAYGIALAINKINRRLLPFYLMILFLTSAIGAASSTMLTIALAIELPFYTLALMRTTLSKINFPLPPILRHASDMAYYFTLGNVGMLLGWWDYLRGQRTATWNPDKSEIIS